MHSSNPSQFKLAFTICSCRACIGHVSPAVHNPCTAHVEAMGRTQDLCQTLIQNKQNQCKSKAEPLAMHDHVYRLSCTALYGHPCGLSPAATKSLHVAHSAVGRPRAATALTAAAIACASNCCALHALAATAAVAAKLVTMRSPTATSPAGFCYCESVTMRSSKTISPASPNLATPGFQSILDQSHPHDDPGAQTMPHH
jgi:hypothetical protein